MKKTIINIIILVSIALILSCSKYIYVSGKPTIIMAEETESGYLSQITIQMSGQPYNCGFIIEFETPRLKDSVYNEFDTLKSIKLEVPKAFSKQSIPSNVLLRATTAKRID